jgi:hypothetical protein
MPISNNLYKPNILEELRKSIYFDENNSSVFLWLCANNYNDALKYFFNLMIEYNYFNFLETGNKFHLTPLFYLVQNNNLDFFNYIFEACKKKKK